MLTCASLVLALATPPAATSPSESPPVESAPAEHEGDLVVIDDDSEPAEPSDDPAIRSEMGLIAVGHAPLKGPLEGEPIFRSRPNDWGLDAPLLPIEAGAMFTVPALSTRGALILGVVSTGFGWQLDRASFFALLRAAVGPRKNTLGWGGVRGGYNVVQRSLIHLAPEVAISAGGGKDFGRKTGLILAVEPGVRARFRTRAGSFDFRTVWFQPLDARRLSHGGAVIASIAYHPLHTDYW